MIDWLCWTPTTRRWLVRLSASHRLPPRWHDWLLDRLVPDDLRVSFPANDAEDG